MAGVTGRRKHPLSGERHAEHFSALSEPEGRRMRSATDDSLRLATQGRGAAVTDLQALLGHSSLQTTSIYATMVDRRTRASVEALDFRTSSSSPR